MQKRSSLLVQAMFACCLFAPQQLLAQAGDAPAVEPFSAIQKEYDAAYQKWLDAYREASTSGDQQAVAALRSKRPTGEAWLDRALRVLDARAKQKDGADAAIWLIRVVRAKGAHLGRALDVLQQHHADSDQLKDIMLPLSRNPAPAVTTFLEKVSKASTSTEIRGRATYAVAEAYKAQAGMTRLLAMMEAEELARYREMIGADVLDVIKAADPVETERRSAKWFEAVMANEEYAAIDYYRGTLGEQAKRTLFELRNLSIGKVAPDIIGEDIDGTPMKLSDYRGKVVVLDFWGDW